MYFRIAGFNMNYIKEIFHIILSSLVSCCFGSKKLIKNRVIITSTQNISYNFNSKYLFEYFLDSQEQHGFDVYYVMNDGVKRSQFNKKYDTNRFIQTTSFSGILFSLKSKYWVSSTFELPVNSLHRNVNRIVLHLGHGVPLKKIGLNEENITFLKRINRVIRTRQFTDIVSYSSQLKNEMVKTFSNVNANYVFLGQPRNDRLISENMIVRQKLQDVAGANADAKFILYAPTWRPYATTKFFPFSIDCHELGLFLKVNNIYILTRSHPFYPSLIDEKIKQLPNVIDFNSDVAPEISDYLAGFDGLVTDYSSIYIDFLVMDRKVAFIPYDLEEYKKKVGFCYSYEDFTPGMKIFDSNDFKTFLTSDNNCYHTKRIDIMKITNTKAAGNSAEIVKYLQSR